MRRHLVLLILSSALALTACDVTSTGSGDSDTAGSSSTDTASDTSEAQDTVDLTTPQAYTLSDDDSTARVEWAGSGTNWSIQVCGSLSASRELTLVGPQEPSPGFRPTCDEPGFDGVGHPRLFGLSGAYFQTSGAGTWQPTGSAQARLAETPQGSFGVGDTFTFEVDVVKDAGGADVAPAQLFVTATSDDDGVDFTYSMTKP